MRTLPIIAIAASLLALSACNNRSEEDAVPAAPADTETVEVVPNPNAPVSILRPDVEPPELPEIPLEPLNVTIGFPEGGDELDAAATAALEQLITSEQVTSEGPIILRAHSDSAGNDAANLRASTARGEKVRDWLIGKGIDEERITLISFGEQNPAQPNAKLDGTPNEAGRAANRRVDIEVVAVEVESVDPEGSGPSD